jgi:hypothetical protein
MNPIRLAIASVFGLLLVAPGLWAQPCYAPIPQAPSACYPTTYGVRCGLVYPQYCPYPPFPPFQGFVPGPPQKGGGPGGGFGGPGGGPGGGGLGSPVFPTHPFARSPRDYYMIYDRDREGERPF